MNEQETCRRSGCDEIVPWTKTFDYMAGLVGDWWYCKAHRGGRAHARTGKS